MTIPKYNETIHGRAEDLGTALINKITSSIISPNALYIRNIRFFMIGCRNKLAKGHSDGYPEGNSFIACRFVERLNFDGSAFWTLDTCTEEEDKKQTQKTIGDFLQQAQEDGRDIAILTPAFSDMSSYHLSEKMTNRVFNDIIDEGWFADSLSAKFQGTVELFDMPPHKKPQQHLTDISNQEMENKVFESLKKTMFNQNAKGGARLETLAQFVKYTYIHGEEESPEAGKDTKMIEAPSGEDTVLIRPAISEGHPSNEKKGTAKFLDNAEQM